ncbi:transposase [Cellulosilyticum ruminicola]|uniref:transposase n=1 Tax=Cellulosilyticum ruminicola TaxID=425254 RepID=UPI0009FA67C7|nr:transposase [Cellulosilyticum ruminicola]
MVAYLKKLTAFNKVNVFILDDSIVTRNRSKSVELLAKVYDHVFYRYQKGFTMLTLGWSDGYSFLPVDFTMLSLSTESNCLIKVSTTIDKKTTGYKRRKETILKKPDIAIKLIQNAVTQGISAQYILMDT